MLTGVKLDFAHTKYVLLDIGESSSGSHACKARDSTMKAQRLR